MNKRFCIFGILLLFASLFSCNLGLFTANPTDEDFPKEGSGINTGDLVVFDAQKSVKNIRASEAESEDSITINWSAFAGADYYTLERACTYQKNKSLASAENWSVVASQITSTTYTDRYVNLKDVYYAYRLRAYSRKNKEYSQYSNVCYGSLLSSPLSIDVSKGKSESQINITFSRIPGASGYNIYKSRKISDKSEFAILNSDVILQNNSQDILCYSYSVDEEEKGQVLYFVVDTVSGTGNKRSEKSGIYSGYTKVKGAPSRVENLKVSQGESSISIAISFDVDTASDEELIYTLSRSSLGSAEKELATFSSSDAVNGVINYTDNEYSLKENTLYTYSLIAENSFGKSEATLGTGYLLSSPVLLSFVPTKTDEKFGYAIEIVHPIGALEHDDWQYILFETYENGVSETKYISTQDIANVFYTCTKTPLIDVDNNYQKEIRFLSIKLHTENGDSVSQVSSSVYPVPSKITDLTASENYFKQSFTGKENYDGLYPIVVNFTSDDDISYSIITRNDAKIFTLDSLTREIEDSDIRLGKKYTYQIEAFDALDRSFGKSEFTTPGYGAIEINKFVDMFEQQCLKPWVSNEHPEYRNNSPYNSIYNYVKQAGTGSLGTSTVNGAHKHETDNSRMYYNAKINGIGGYVTFEYWDFGECDYMYIKDYAKYCMDVNASGNGSITDNTIFNIAGWYTGTVDFSRLSVKNQAFSGNYIVNLNYSGFGSMKREIAPKN